MDIRAGDILASPGIILIIIGLLLFLIGLFGCIGVVKELIVLLIIVSVHILVLFFQVCHKNFFHLVYHCIDNLSDT